MAKAKTVRQLPDVTNRIPFDPTGSYIVTLLVVRPFAACKKLDCN